MQFTNPTTIEPLMFIYKDYNYVKYVVSLDFGEAYKLIKTCRDRIQKEETDKLRELLMQLYVIEIQNGYKLDFEAYFNSKTKKPATEIKNVVETETRIINKVINLDVSRLRERKLF
jgi:hypothetical protein